MEPITLALLGGGALLGLWALTSKSPQQAEATAAADKLAALVSTTGPKGERMFLPEQAKNLLVQLSAATVTTPDLSQPSMVEYAPVPSGKAIPTDQSAFGWVSRENKDKSVLAPLYAVTTAAAKQRKFLRSVAPGTESDLAGPNGIYAVLAYAGTLAKGLQPPGTPPLGVVPSPPAPPKPPGPPPQIVPPAVPPPPGAPILPGPVPPIPNIPGIILPASFTPPTQPQPPGQVPLPPVPTQDALPPGPAIVTTQTDPLNIRALPSTTAAIVGKVPKGSTLTVTGPMVNGMAPISFGALIGFAYGGYLRAVAPTSPAAILPTLPAAAIPGAIPVSVTTQSPVSTVIEPAGARIRSTPSSAVSTNVLGALAKGSTVSITGPAQSATGENWVPVTVVTTAPGSNGNIQSGTTGFVASRLLSSQSMLAGRMVDILAGGNLNVLSGRAQIVAGAMKNAKRKGGKIISGW
jgi:hypothetical protein